MKKLSSKGFTLIELLVVITIIGILATGATAVYTSAQQKARDSVRQSDILALQSAMELKYANDAEYPTSANTALTTGGYINAIPTDSQDGDADSSTNTMYRYVYAASDDGGVKQGYEFSAAFEATSNASDETGDGGNDTDRFEIGSDVGTVDSTVTSLGVYGTNTYNTTASTSAAVVAN